MSAVERDDEGVRVLHRMIAYVREEALRLRIPDVALLLDHAEDAVVAFAPAALADHAARRTLRDRPLASH